MTRRGRVGKAGHFVEDPAERSRSRFWTSPDGRRYRVWLAPPGRHLMMHGKAEWTLTFVPIHVPLAEMRDLSRSVPAGTVLERLTDTELVELLGP